MSEFVMCAQELNLPYFVRRRELTGQMHVLDVSRVFVIQALLNPVKFPGYAISSPPNPLDHHDDLPNQEEYEIRHE